MPRQPEGKLVQKIKELWTAKGARCIKIVATEGSYQEVGLPDLIICYRGWFIGAEIKQLGEELRPMQKVVLREIHQAGGIIAVLETTGQAALLLSILEKRGYDGKGMCFVRGIFKSDLHFD